MSDEKNNDYIISLKLKKSYADMIYLTLKGMLLEKHQGKVSYRCSLGEFKKNVLKIDYEVRQRNIYDRYSDLNRRIISPAVKEINSKTDILVTCSPYRAGRSITGLDWTIDKKVFGIKTSN